MKDNLLVQFILPKKDIKQITKTSLNNLFSGTVFFIFIIWCISGFNNVNHIRK